eukprot:9294289-Alexandrium_andersonii.AAC.1
MASWPASSATRACCAARPAASPWSSTGRTRRDAASLMLSVRSAWAGPGASHRRGKPPWSQNWPGPSDSRS